MKKKYPLYILSVLSCVYLLISCFKTPTQHISTKIKGVSVVGAPKEIENTSFTEIININSNYVALIPYAFVPKTEASVITNHGYQWWGETPEGIIKCIKMADSLHLKVMIKPQLWFAHGEYTGNINFSSEKEWLQWEKHYTEYIMRFVKLANDWNVELFCIGTELKRAVENRPDFWINLISKIRKSYNGKLTYAANWDEYEDLIFWNKLDFIGIDAYFPLCQKKCNYSSLINQWRSISNRLEKFSAKIQRPILFTEFGYPSAEYAYTEPWRSDYSKSNNKKQELAYKAFFETTFLKPWLKGVFIWKWYAEPEQHNISKHDFTPQAKPALNEIKQAFKP